MPRQFSTRSRLLVFSATAVLISSLLGNGGGGATAATAPSPDESAISVFDTDRDGTLDAPDSGTASGAAKDRGDKVEDLSQRTGSASVFANPDGSFTRRDFGAAVRVKESGEWVPVDYTLAEQADGSYAPKASAVDITVAGGSAREAARVSLDGDESLAFTWPKDLPDPSVDGGVATYKLSDASDLVVAVTGNGVTARIRLNEEPATDDPVFKLGLRADSLDLEQTPATGALKITDQDGETVGGAEQLLAWDSATDEAGDPSNVVELDANLEQTTATGDVTNHSLELTAPEGFLSDPATEYPVTIDPNIRVGGVRDTWVRSGQATTYGDDFRLIVGKVNGSDNTNPARSYLKFFDSRVDTNPDVKVTNATLSLWQYYGYSCTDRRMYAMAAGSAWSDNLSWGSGMPGGTGTAAYVDDNRGASGCGQGWTKLDITSIANAWNTGAIDNNGLRLHAGDEDYSSFERRFCSMDYVSTEAVCNTASRAPVLETTYTIELLNPSSPIKPGETRQIQVAGTRTIPDDRENGTATIKLTAAEWNASGTATLYRADEDRPPTPTLTFTEGSTADVSKTVTVGISDDGSVALTNSSTGPLGVYLTVLEHKASTGDEPLDNTEDTEDPEPAEVPVKMSSVPSETCSLPDGILQPEDFPVGATAQACDAVGRAVQVGNAMVQIPNPGEWRELSLVSATEYDEASLRASVDPDGLIAFEAEPAVGEGAGVPVGALAANPPPCSDTSRAFMGHRWKDTYKWYLGGGKMPGGVSRSKGKRLFRDAINNITDAYNDCGLPDRVGATAKYGGTTNWRGDFAMVDGKSMCPKDMDGKSTWDAGELDKKTVAGTCLGGVKEVTGWNPVTEADVRYNTKLFDFAAAMNNCYIKLDVRAIGTHEAGHVFGLAHVTGNHENLTMTTDAGDDWCDPKLRTLGKGDIMGLETLY